MEAAVFDHSGDVVECASESKALVTVVAVDSEDEDVAEGPVVVVGDGESVNADSLEISFIILRSDG